MHVYTCMYVCICGQEKHKCVIYIDFLEDSADVPCRSLEVIIL